MSCKGPRRPAWAGGAVHEWWAAHARRLEFTDLSGSSSMSSIFGPRKRSHLVLQMGSYKWGMSGVQMEKTS
jgi:hypothetical protein